MAGRGVEDNFLPIGSDEEASFFGAVGDDVGQAVFGEVSGDGCKALGAFVDGVFFPECFGGIG